MRALQKIILSLLISSISFLIFSILVYTDSIYVPYINSLAANIILLTSLFLTIFLTVFFLFNLRHDDTEFKRDEDEKLISCEEFTGLTGELSRDHGLSNDKSHFNEIQNVENMSGLNSGLFMKCMDYLALTGKNVIEELETVREKTSEKIIEIRDGVHFISSDVLNHGQLADSNYNNDFKNLVNSVLKS